MEYTFRKAKVDEQDQIWAILKDAIRRRKEEGSDQWQDGYPNPGVIKDDIDKGVGFVLLDRDEVVGYCAVLINDEPQYADIEGQWLTDGDFVVIHRVAISENYLGQGLAKKMLQYIEGYALENNIHSVKADTNFDNPGMLHIFKKTGYTYCGEVILRGKPRKAFEKVLTDS
ncbi:GNAT family N-acetyltransferase [Sphingobacterium sp. SGG-5]|uniref:GNAT family N-acetyltransferase n=1 Tax=Sphingobacterium sp. SGG-5 TaxID=2710881 RepID=UPI0013EC92E8|nr:GNAT family N-acetyltransferase [Sphingobacterium sp. SGG-5]NGM63489.1 GNAT family N-acetyltransferase [Sphingobacterium sp. SGG-5]